MQRSGLKRFAAKPEPEQSKPRVRTLVLLLDPADYQAIVEELDRRRADRVTEEWFPRSDDPEPESSPDGQLVAELARDFVQLKRQAATPHAVPPATDYEFPTVPAPVAEKNYRTIAQLVADVLWYLRQIPRGMAQEIHAAGVAAVLFTWRGKAFWFFPVRGRATAASVTSDQAAKLCARLKRCDALGATVRSVADVQAALQASAFMLGRSK